MCICKIYKVSIINIIGFFIILYSSFNFVFYSLTSINIYPLLSIHINKITLRSYSAPTLEIPDKSPISPFQ